MIRPAGLILFTLSAIAGAVLFGVAFEVSALEERLVALNNQISRDREAIHVLRAEWSYLNQPERLEGLSQRYLDLQPLAGAQMSDVAALPERPVAGDPDGDAVTPQAPPPAAAAIAGTLNARPKAKPSAPARPAEPERYAVPPVDAATVQTAAMSADDSSALDAALRAIFGDTARSAGGSAR